MNGKILGMKGKLRRWKAVHRGNDILRQIMNNMHEH